jgi:hypothetical protein
MYLSIINTSLWLLWRDIRLLRKNMVDTLIDSLIMPTSFIIIGGYIFPYLGMPANYGSFMVVGSLMMMCYGACAWLGASPLIADLENDRSITYILTLPIPSWIVPIKIATGFACQAMIRNIFTLILGKIILLDRFDLSQLSIPKFALMYVIANLLFGFLATTIAFWVNNSFEFGRFWMRIGSQLVFFSGFQFTWYVFYKSLPTLAYIDLINPLLYAFEGTRAAILGQHSSLNYWVCVGVSLMWIVVLGFVSNYLFKKKLDCV